jgi:hypothetical protein
MGRDNKQKYQTPNHDAICRTSTRGSQTKHAIRYEYWQSREAGKNKEGSVESRTYKRVNVVPKQL